MFEEMTDEQLIEANLALKTEQLAIREKRKAYTEELKRRDFERGLEAQMKNLSPAVREALAKKFGGSGNVTIGVPTATLNLRGN